MRFKYVISLEGNDVASNLKSILASNSLCLISEPTWETRFMGRLQAGRHYVPLNPEMDDVEAKILYYERNAAEALEIIRTANAFAAQFVYERRETAVLAGAAQVLRRHRAAGPDKQVAGRMHPPS